MEKTELDANIGDGNAPRKISGMKWNLRIIGAFAVLGTLALAASCRGFFVNPTITSLAIGPSNLTLAPSTSYQMVATATYSDGSTNDVTGQSLWTSSNTSVANFTAPGLLAAGSLQALGSSLPGTTSVSASDGAVSSSAQTVNVCPTVQNMTLTVSSSSSGTGGSSVSVTGGSQVFFVVTATFNGVTGTQTVTDSVTWNIGNTSALPSITDGTGTTVSGNASTFNVSASLCGVSSNNVTVTTTS
jgi:trimeric autotransporter adhesin